MEPLDSDFEYVVRQPRKARTVSIATRYNLLLIFPSLGILWLLYLIGAAVFQWPVTAVVSPVMVLMVLIFVVLVAILFWAKAPKSDRT
jgi:hypothetical protein